MSPRSPHAAQDPAAATHHHGSRTKTITIPTTHNGPALSGHGGAAAGRFAAAINSNAATVRFHNPIPMGQPLRSVGDSNEIVIFDSEDPIATVRPLPAPLRVSQFERLEPEVVARAEHRWLDARDGQHMAPTCFACGPDRHDQLGLGLRPGPVEVSALFACRWSPKTDDAVPDWLVWAALDCPSGFPALHDVRPNEAVVTGELSVEILAQVTSDGDYQLISRRIAGEGRRHTTEAALIDLDGVAVAVANAVWITVPLTATRLDASTTAAAAWGTGSFVARSRIARDMVPGVDPCPDEHDEVALDLGT